MQGPAQHLEAYTCIEGGRACRRVMIWLQCFRLSEVSHREQSRLLGTCISRRLYQGSSQLPPVGGRFQCPGKLLTVLLLLGTDELPSCMCLGAVFCLMAKCSLLATSCCKLY